MTAALYCRPLKLNERFVQGNLQAIQHCYGPLCSINDAIIHLTYLHFTSIQLIRPVKSISFLCWARDKRDPSLQIKADFVSGRREGVWGLGLWFRK